MGTFLIHTPPGVILVAKARPEAQTVKGQELDLSERARLIQERRIWRAVIDAECQRLEFFLGTCTFD